jgi:F-type H+-transporting ATPase subunit a
MIAAKVKPAAGPMDQFEIKELIPFGTESYNLAFTNASLWMAIAVFVGCLFMFLATSKSQLVPGRMQSAGEMLYTFVADMLRDVTGPDGMKFFPYIFTLFFFILLCNFLGLFPSIPGTPDWFHTFTPTSHLAVTLALALLTISIVIVYGLFKNGFKFFKLFAPSGVPAILLPLIIVIELVSFLSRPLSLAIRLFANMLAGHLILKLFATFAIGLFGAGGIFGVIGIIPILGNVAITLLELLVAFLQAYIFAILSSMYLADALHPDH